MSNMQSGISLDVFIPVIQAELRNLIKPLPPPVNVLYPDYLTKFISMILLSMDEYQKQQILCKTISAVGKSKSKATVLVISPSDTEYIDNVLEKISPNKNLIKSLFIIPRNTAYIEQIIKKHELTSITNVPKNNKEIMVQDFHADFTSVENGFFLLPGKNTFRQFFIDNDYTELYSAARSIAKIQYLYGNIPEIVAVGSASAHLKGILNGIQAKIEQNSHSIPQIDSLLLIDRAIDPLSVVVTNSPLDKLIDELYGIQFGTVFSGNPICPEGKAAKEFTDVDEIWSDFRKLSITNASNKVSDLVKELSESVAEVEHTKEQVKMGVGVDKEKFIRLNRVKNLRPFMEQAVDYVTLLRNDILKKIPAYRAIITAEYGAFINSDSPLLVAEHLVSILGDWRAALRLLILGCVTRGSYDDNTVLAIGRELISEFGARAIPAMLSLERLGYISSEKFAWNWKALNRELKLFMEEDQNKGYKDPLAEPHEGFIPLAVRLAQRVANGSLGKVPELLGSNFSISGAKPSRVEGEVRRILVFFVGGVTYAEQKLVRSIGELPEYKGKVEFIVGATETINGNSMIEQIAPWLEPKQEGNK